MDNDNSGNQIDQTVTTVMMTIHPGTKVYIGGTPVTLVSEATIATHPINAPQVRLELESQRVPTGIVTMGARDIQNWRDCDDADQERIRASER